MTLKDMNLVQLDVTQMLLARKSSSSSSGGFFQFLSGCVEWKHNNVEVVFLQVMVH